MNRTRRSGIVLATVLGLAVGVSGAGTGSRNMQPPWEGGVPRPKVTTWRNGDRLAEWTMPPAVKAEAVGSAAAPTTSSIVPFRAKSRKAGLVPGEVSVWESALGVVEVAVRPPTQAGVSAVTIEFPLAAGEHIVGLGERFGRLDLRGRVWDNYVEDHVAEIVKTRSYSPMPFLISSSGYGLALDTDYPAVFDVGATRTDRLLITTTDPLPHLRLLTGRSPGEIITRQAAVVGLPPLPPRWGLGVWKNLIGGALRVTSDARRLGAAGVPIDAVWIYDAVDDRSGFGWQWPIYDPIPQGEYPDVAGLIQSFHRVDIKVLGYMAPFIYRGSTAFVEAVSRGYLIAGADGRPVLEDWGGTTRGQVDFSNPAAASWFADRVSSGLSLGFDGAMQDYGEGASVEARYASGQPGVVEHNRYPLRFAQAVDAAVAATKPGQAVFFARSGGPGTQRYATARFTGDQLRSWDPARGLPSALHAMLSGSISGWPYWGPDIAGFVVPADTGRDERELWTRWVQLGALSPVMRDMLGNAHQATDALTDEGTLAVFRAYARLHTALEPYLYRMATLAHTTGLPIMRPLFLAAPRDPVAWTVDDEYLLGDDLLVAPVLQPGQTTRLLYLPEGIWRDYWTGHEHKGPGWTKVPAPLDRVPLLVRQGADPGLPDPATLWAPPGGHGQPALALARIADG